MDLTKILNIAGKALGTTSELTAGALTAAGAGLASLGLVGGYLGAKASSPRSVTENADKELLREALATEIDVTQRRLAALELRKKKLAEQRKGPQQYDRFV